MVGRLSDMPEWVASFERAKRLIFVVMFCLIASGLAGCTTSSNYAPRPAFAIDADIRELHEQFATTASIKGYYAAGQETSERRNEFIAGRLVLYDLEYIRFLSRFRLSRAEEATAFDAVALGVGLATTIVKGERTKTILGAITTALTGARSSYEKNYYDDKTAAALVTQMNAERKTALIPLVVGSKADIKDYPLTAALTDLTNYQFAGTIDGALAGVQRDAGIKDVKATAILEQYRSVAYAPDDSTSRIQKWLFPGLATFDANGVAKDSAGNTIAVDANHLGQLRAEMKKLELDGLPIASFMVAGALAEARMKVIKTLSIP